MRNKKKLHLTYLAILSLFTCITLNSCVANQYKSFVTGEPGWTDILISKKVKPEIVLNKCVEIITRKGYEPEMISKDTGYMRTKWKHIFINASGMQQTATDYRLRVVVQVGADGEKVGLKCIAERNIGLHWIAGSDNEELKSISELIRGSIAGY